LASLDHETIQAKEMSDNIEVQKATEKINRD
jgi:hypothetical protein